MPFRKTMQDRNGKTSEFNLQLLQVKEKEDEIKKAIEMSQTLL